MRPATLLTTALVPLVALSSPTPAHDSSPPPEAEILAPDWPSLSQLLNRVHPGVLHTVLHSLAPKYQDGVFDDDRSAVASVHASDHIVATKLVHLALKRQDNGTVPETTPSSTPTPTPTPTPDSTTPPAETTPSQTPETTPSASPSSTPTLDASQSSVIESQSSVIESQLQSQVTASEQPSPTTVEIAPTTPPNATPVRTVDGGVVFSTIGGGVVTATSARIPVSFTKSSSTRISVTTNADGSVQTLTSVVVVNAPVTGSGDAEGAAATGSGPGLQNVGGPGAVVVSQVWVWSVAVGAGLAGVMAFAL